MGKNYIDELARNALRNLEVHYNPDDWAVMNARLDQEKQLTTRLLFFKGLEMSFLAIAIWTLFQFLPAGFGGNQNQGFSNQPAGIVPAEKQSMDTEDKLQGTDILNPSEELEKSKTEQDGPTAELDSRKGKKSDKLADQNLVNKGTSIISGPLQNPNTRESNIINQNTTAYSESLTPNLIDDSNFESHAERYAFSSQSLIKKNLLNPGEPDLPKMRRTHSDPVPDKIRRPMYIGAQASPDMNTLGDNLNMGFTLGLLMGRELNDKWDLEWGLLLGYKPFDYISAEEQANPNAINPEQKVMLTVLEIPLMAQYNFNKSINWRSYATFGTSGFLVASADYNKENIELPWTFDDKSDKGLFQGGKFSSNFYLSANLGFGLERKLTRKVHLFIQPTFSYPLTSVGPFNDKLGTFSLSMGARATL